jgi:hypothetical protein
MCRKRTIERLRCSQRALLVKRVRPHISRDMCDRILYEYGRPSADISRNWAYSACGCILHACMASDMHVDSTHSWSDLNWCYPQSDFRDGRVSRAGAVGRSRGFVLW